MIEIDSKKLGDRLRRTRKELRMTQTDVSREFNVGGGRVSEYEQGKYEPPFKLALGLSIKAGKNVVWLMTGEGEEYTDVAIRKVVQKFTDRLGNQIKPYSPPETGTLTEIYRRHRHVYNEVLHISKLEIANRLGIPSSIIEEIESGAREMSIDYLANFCKTLGINLNWLVYGGDMPIFAEKSKEVSVVAEEPATYSTRGGPVMSKVISYLQANPGFLQDIYKIIEGRQAAAKLQADLSETKREET